MDYTTLYAAWKKEKENPKIQPLDRRFFTEVSGYIKDLKDEIEMLDGKTLLAHLALEKQKNLEKIITDLIQIRYTKISTALFKYLSISFHLYKDHATRIVPHCHVITYILSMVLVVRSLHWVGHTLSRWQSRRSAIIRPTHCGIVYLRHTASYTIPQHTCPTWHHA